MKNSYILMLLGILISFAGNSQYPTINWEKVDGGTNHEYPYNIIQLTDSSYLTVGYSYQSSGGNKTSRNYGYTDGWVIKRDKLGNKIWDKSYGGSSDDRIIDALALPSGGALLLATSSSVPNLFVNKKAPNKGGLDYWLIQIDNNGNIIWQKTYGGIYTDFATSIAMSADGNYFIAGYSYSPVSGDKSSPSKGGYDFWILKVDPSGNKIWDRTIGGNNTDLPSSIIGNSDGGCTIVGSSSSTSSGDKSESSINGYDYWVVRLNDNGIILWENTIRSATELAQIASLIEINNSIFILGASSGPLGYDKTVGNNRLYDYWLINLNKQTGNNIWQKLYGGSGYEYACKIHKTNNNEFILKGQTTSSISGDKTEPSRGGYDIWLLKVDDIGNIIWDKTIGGRSQEFNQSYEKGITTDIKGLITIESATVISPPGGDKSFGGYGGVDFWTIQLKDNTVVDNTPPTVMTKDITVQLDVMGNATITTQDIDNGTSDPSGIASLTIDMSNFDCSNVGPNIVTLTATDNFGNSAQGQATVTVEDNVRPTVITRNIIAQLDVNGMVTITPMQIDNGSSDACGIANYQISKSEFYCGDVGENIINLAVTDNNGNTEKGQAIVTVEDNIPPYVSTLDATIQIDATGHAYLNIGLIDNGSSDACGTESISLDRTDFTCNDVGENIVTLTVIDLHGNSAQGQATVTVINDDPVINSLSLPINPNPIETQINASATFTDDNISEAEFNWGDGSSSLGNIMGSDITDSHTYLMPGVYEVSLTITDVCGQQDTEVFQYVVIYDPYGGFVTGGGYIWSHPGYYTPDPLAEGKANFGFVAKYKKGATTPTGNTQFMFTAGEMNFHSTEYDWLVIAGQKAMYKGSGTINGAGSYKFMLSAIDGTSKADGDRFRMQILDMFDNVIYDNQPGDDENVDASTYLGGGSITIHDGSNNGNQTNSLIADPAFEKIHFYPNPVSSTLNIQLTERFMTGSEPLEIKIYEANGKSVGFYEYSNFNTKVLQLRVEDLNNGVYILTIEKGSEFEHLKFIKD
ncbi:T9SS type A sorting domain-containing protein [Marinigracilibium pacificum]|uniref:T9SS type A sorting domain-containing protein n=1 Tax=Marinigracilibium pacificum TaxID=2729599 RepID=A0A848J1I1_9BACT|nr:T9SS type A sorting domain-containing protein [Marinigracilibium pacificum]NMM49666.1 T9SS type A sorting domain-containing protein [Marinigracilibium pacificum]